MSNQLKHDYLQSLLKYLNKDVSSIIIKYCRFHNILKHELKGHTSVVSGVIALSNNTIISSSYDGTLSQWTLVDNNYICTRVLKAHSVHIFGLLKISNTKIISYSQQEIILWTILKEKNKNKFTFEYLVDLRYNYLNNLSASLIESVTILDENTIIYVLRPNINNILIFDINLKQTRQVINDELVYNVSVFNKNILIVNKHLWDSRVYILQGNQYIFKYTIPTFPPDEFENSTFLTKYNEDNIIYSTKSGSIRILKYENDTFNLKQTFKLHENIILDAIYVKDNLLISVAYDKTLSMCDLKNNKQNTLSKLNYNVAKLFLLNDDILIGGCDDNVIRIWF